MEITDKEQVNQEQSSESNSCEIQNSFPPSIQNEAVDVFEGPRNSHEPEVTCGPFDISKFDSSVSDKIQVVTNPNEADMKSHISQLNRSLSDTSTNTGTKYNAKELDICEGVERYAPRSDNTSDSAASPNDLDVFDQIELTKWSRENGVEETFKHLESSERLPVKNDDFSDVFGHQNTKSEDMRLKNGTESSERGNYEKIRLKTKHEENFERPESGSGNKYVDESTSPLSSLLGNSRSPTDAINLDDPKVVYDLLPEVHITNAPCDEVMYQKPPKTVHDLPDDQPVVVNGQSGVGNGQTGVTNGQTSRMNSQTGAVNVVNDQAGVMKGQNNVQPDVENGRRYAGNFRTDVNGKVIEESSKVRKSRSTGLWHGIFRLFGRKSVEKEKQSRC